MSHNGETPSSSTQNSRLGFHYYPDALHYRQSDLNAWLPELRALGASWLTLIAPMDRAIPEAFIKGLLQADIQPLLHFHLPLSHPVSPSSMDVLFRVYAEWGVRYVVLFDRPNSRASWSASTWVQSDLVERFLDRYLPLANAALQAGLIPVFPPLEPGGDYWDIAFLRAALQSMRRRGQEQVLDSLHLSAYAWADEHPLNWGAGGPERWPGARPYFTPIGQEDQRGFYIFDWYLAQVQAVLSRPCPILLVAAGSRLKCLPDDPEHEVDETSHATTNLAIARLLTQNEATNSAFEPISPHVLACNFWLLAATDGTYAAQAWFQPDGSVLPVVIAMKRWVEKISQVATTMTPITSPEEEQREVETQPVTSAPPIIEQDQTLVETAFPPSANLSNPHQEAPHPITHYLLLPLPDFGAMDWHLDVARPFILRHHPTVGYSIKEAKLAQRVTVVGGEQIFPEALLEDLRRGGCQVTRIAGDGTDIATQLASL